jgi:hypothetical protein
MPGNPTRRPPVNLLATSTEFLHVPVTTTVNGAPYDPTSDTVQMAFMATGVPASSDWHPSTWETVGSTHNAICLIGPAGGGIPLAPGTYTVYVRVTDNPEIPVKQAGYLTIT